MLGRDVAHRPFVLVALDVGRVNDEIGFLQADIAIVGALKAQI